jgi:hypothetical protein
MKKLKMTENAPKITGKILEISSFSQFLKLIQRKELKKKYGKREDKKEIIKVNPPKNDFFINNSGSKLNFKAKKNMNHPK